MCLLKRFPSPTLRCTQHAVSPKLLLSPQRVYPTTYLEKEIATKSGYLCGLGQIKSTLWFCFCFLRIQYLGLTYRIHHAQDIIPTQLMELLALWLPLASLSGPSVLCEVAVWGQ